MFNSDEMDKRLSSRPSLAEFAAILFVFLVSIGLVITNIGFFGDYKAYLMAANGQADGYYYGYWLLPIFYVLSIMPFKLSVLIWIILSISGVWFATKVFNGNTILALVAYQMLYSVYYGQITGVICGLLGIFWWAIHHKKWFIAGIVCLLAIAKPHTGGVFIFFLWLFADISWKERIKILIIPFLGIISTFAIYPEWLMEICFEKEGLCTLGNISLWQWIGGFSLLILLPALFVG